MGKYWWEWRYRVEGNKVEKNNGTTIIALSIKYIKKINTTPPPPSDRRELTSKSNVILRILDLLILSCQII